jgi:acyl carrier protein
LLDAESSGKRDASSRKGQSNLSKWKHSRPKLSTDYVVPRSDIERAIAAVWEDLLSVEKVGAHDDFFELGGHSLLGTQVISRIYQLFNVQLPLRKLFEERTVEALAAFLEVFILGAGSCQPGTFDTEEREVIEI